MLYGSRLLILTTGITACAVLLYNYEGHNPPPVAGIAAPPDSKIYRTLDDCLAEASSMDAVHTCREGYRAALEKQAEAPRFDQQARCEDVYGPGNCVPRGSVVHDGGSGFVPFMFGYMLGGGNQTNYMPVYVDRRGSTYAGSSVISSPSWSGGSSGGFVSSGRPSAPSVATLPSSVERGGFGSTAMAHANSSSVGG
jgi:uncharacterized protein YgiB involved in biofilm formation